MILPVRCFTCGNILADKELAYRDLVERRKSAEGDTSKGLPFMFNVETMRDQSADSLKSVEGQVLDDLGVVKMCCRRHMLTSVDCLEFI